MRRTILWFLFGIVIILAGIVLWPEREPDIYRLEKRTGPEADEAIKLVREACKEFPRIGEKKTSSNICFGYRRGTGQTVRRHIF